MNLTSCVQPLDVGVHRALREYLHVVFGEKASRLQNITKQNLLATVKPAVVRAFTKKNIQAGFRKTGLIPLDAQPILDRLNRKKDKLAEVREQKGVRNQENGTAASSAVPADAHARGASTSYCWVPPRVT